MTDGAPYPVPIAFSHNTGGPFEGHWFNRFVSLETPFARGPSRRGQSSPDSAPAESASAAVSRITAGKVLSFNRGLRFAARERAKSTMLSRNSYFPFEFYHGDS